MTRLYKRYSDLWHEDVVILVLNAIYLKWYTCIVRIEANDIRLQRREDVSKDNKDYLESYDARR